MLVSVVMHTVYGGVDFGLHIVSLFWWDYPIYLTARTNFLTGESVLPTNYSETHRCIDSFFNHGLTLRLEELASNAWL